MGRLAGGKKKKRRRKKRLDRLVPELQKKRRGKKRVITPRPCTSAAFYRLPTQGRREKKTGKGGGKKKEKRGIDTQSPGLSPVTGKRGEHRKRRKKKKKGKEGGSALPFTTWNLTGVWTDEREGRRKVARPSSTPSLQNSRAMGKTRGKKKGELHLYFSFIFARGIKKREEKGRREREDGKPF